MPPTPSPADDLARRLGAHLKVLRERAQLRQSDVAKAAQGLDIDWTSTTVGAIENGTRRLALDEYFVVPSILALARAITTPDAELRGGLDAPPEYTLAQVCPDEIVKAWRQARPGLALTAQVQRWRSAPYRKIWAREVGQKPEIPVGDPAVDQQRQQPVPEAIDDWAREEATLAAAKVLKRDPLVVALRSWTRWRRSLGEQRNFEFFAQDPTGALPPDRASRTRGHITRRLVALLRTRVTTTKEGGPTT